MDKTRLAIVGAIAALTTLPMTASVAQAAPDAAPSALHGGTLQQAEWIWVGHRRHWRHGLRRHDGYGYGYGWRRPWRHHHRW